MSVNRFKFGIRKAVGTPSAEGAMGTETLASHTSNPSAHADYVRKNCIPRVFDETEHLLSKTVHASNYLRRDEVMTSRLDYVLAKDSSYTKDSSNYMKEDGVRRHVVTAFVLRQVLDELGLLDGVHDYLSKAAIVRSDAGTPLGDWETLVPSYKVLTNISTTLAANNTAMQTAIDKFTKECGDKATTAATTAASAVETANAATKTANFVNGHYGYVRTCDTKFIADKAYYMWWEDTGEMIRIVRLPGTDISDEEYYEELKVTVNQPVVEAGYARSLDTSVVSGKTYYRYDYVNNKMTTAFLLATTNPADEGLWELLTDLTTKPMSHGGYMRTTDTTVTTGKPYYTYNYKAQVMEKKTGLADDANPSALGLWELISDVTEKPMAHAGYTQTADLAPDSTKTYYTYDYASKTMIEVDKPDKSAISSYWEKITPRGIPFPDWTKSPSEFAFTMSDDKKQYDTTVPSSGTVFLSMHLETSDDSARVNLSVVPTAEGSDPVVLATFGTVHTYDGSSSTTRVPCIISFRADVGTKLRLSLTDTSMTFKDAVIEMAKVFPDKLM